MKVTIKTTNITLTPAIRELIEEKISTLDKFIPYVDSLVDPVRGFKARKKAQNVQTSNGVEAWVEVGVTTRHHHKGRIYRAEANVQVPGQLIRAQAEQEDLRTAITEVKDELQQELKKYKGKREAQDKRRGRLSKVLTRLSPFARFRRKKGERIRNEGA